MPWVPFNLGRAINIEGEIKKRGKEIVQKIKQRRLRAITLQEAIETWKIW